jgi:hypothetical protein
METERHGAEPCGNGLCCPCPRLVGLESQGNHTMDCMANGLSFPPTKSKIPQNDSQDAELTVLFPKFFTLQLK